MLADHGVCHYEEPCPYWEFEWTAEVTRAVSVPVAGGEQVGVEARVVRPGFGMGPDADARNPLGPGRRVHSASVAKSSSVGTSTPST